MTPRAALRTMATLLFGVLALTACDPGEAPGPTGTSPIPTVSPSPTTPTPTAGPVEPPQTEDEAIEHAIAALDRYMELRSAVYADPAGTHDIDAVTDGAAAQRLREEAPQLAADGIRAEGEFRFDVITATTSELIVDGQSIPFGTVTIDGCYDSTNVELSSADGEPIEVTQDRRLRFAPVVVYRAVTHSWVVHDTTTPTQVEPC